MAVALTGGRAKTITLATTVQLLTGLDTADTVFITAPAATAVLIIDAATATDGGAVGTDFIRVHPGTTYAYELPPGPVTLGVASETGTPVAYVRAI